MRTLTRLPYWAHSDCYKCLPISRWRATSLKTHQISLSLFHGPGLYSVRPHSLLARLRLLSPATKFSGSSACQSLNVSIISQSKGTDVSTCISFILYPISVYANAHSPCQKRACASFTTSRGARPDGRPTAPRSMEYVNTIAMQAFLLAGFGPK